MRTSAMLKPTTVKKTVPIKWRDSTWSPRIIIRSLNKRRAGLIFFEPAASRASSSVVSEQLWPAGMPHLRRAGELLPGLGDARQFHRTFLFPLSRFSSVSRLDNLF